MNSLFDVDALSPATLPTERVHVLDLIVGTQADDTLTGTKQDDEIHGRSGDDLIFGGRGDDLIQGGHGSDTVDGGAGDDAILGDRGGDSLFGGAGDDYIVANAIGDPAASGHETVDGGSGDDTLYGSFNRDQIDGGRGDDLIHATAGSDADNGGAGTDTYIDDRGFTLEIDLAAGMAHAGASTATLVSIENAVGGNHADLISGGGKDNVLTGADGEDTLSGAGGNDSLHGGAGSDRITGGLGADVLDGGGGPDLFVYAHTAESDAAHSDLILDLVEGDVIDLSAIDADRAQAGDQAFHLVEGGLTGAAGELALVHDAGSDETLLEGDVDGDGAADLVVRLSGDQTDFSGFVL